MYLQAPFAINLKISIKEIVCQIKLHTKRKVHTKTVHIIR